MEFNSQRIIQKKKKEKIEEQSTFSKILLSSISLVDFYHLTNFYFFSVYD